MSKPIFLKLRAALLVNGYYQKDLPKLTGKSDSYCQRRITGRKPWDLGDVYTLMDRLKLNKTEVHLYFPNDSKT